MVDDITVNLKSLYPTIGSNLCRYGNQDLIQIGCIDDLVFGYQGNQLIRVSDSVSGPYYNGAFHFLDGADDNIEYEYNKNGCVTKEVNKSISSIQYDLLYLPTRILYSNGAYETFLYSADGHKLQTKYILLDPIPHKSKTPK